MLACDKPLTDAGAADRVVPYAYRAILNELPRVLHEQDRQLLPGVRFSVHPVTPAVPRLAVGDRERCVPAGRGQRGREACLNEVGHADDTAR